MTLKASLLAILTDICICIPVLLEGSPGVGKTSLIVALGRYFQHRVVRINLSEQVSDLQLSHGLAFYSVFSSPFLCD